MDYEPRFLSFEAQASRPMGGVRGWLRRYFGEASLIYGDKLVLEASSAEQYAHRDHRYWMTQLFKLKDSPFRGLVRGRRGTLESALLMYTQDAWADPDQRAKGEALLQEGTTHLQGKSWQELRKWLSSKDIGLELDRRDLKVVGLEGKELLTRLKRLGELEEKARWEYVDSSPKARRLRHLITRHKRKIAQLNIKEVEVGRELREAPKDRELKAEAKRLERERLKLEEELPGLEEELIDYLYNWGITWHVPHVWEARTRPLSGLRGRMEQWVWRLMGDLGHVQAERIRQGVTKRGKNPTGLPSHVHFRFGKERIGKQGYTMSPVIAYDAYFRSHSHVVNMNRFLEKMGARINGIWVPGTIENLRVGDGYSRQQRDGGPGHYTGMVSYRGDWARVDEIRGTKEGPIFVLSRQGEPDPIEVSGDKLAFLSRRWSGLTQVMDDWSFREFQNYIDEIVFRREPMDSQDIVGRINRSLGKQARGYFYHMMLGMFNLKSAANNIWGGQMMLLTEIGPLEFMKTMADYLRNPVQAHQRAADAGILESRFVSELAGHKAYSAGSLKELAKAISFLPFSAAEAFNRAVAYAAGTRIAAERGLSGEEMHEWGMHTVARSQFLFTKANTPKAFRKGGKGLASVKTAFFLWQYTTRWWNQLERWFMNPEFKQVDKGVGWWLWANSIPHILRKTTGVDMRGVTSTGMREIPGFGQLGRSLEQFTGWHPDWPINNVFPMLAPFDLFSVPVKVGVDMVHAGITYLWDDQEVAAGQRAKIVGRNLRYLMGRTPAAIMDLLNAERLVVPRLDGKGNVTKWVVKHPHGNAVKDLLEDWFPGTSRSGEIKREYPDLFKLIYSYMGAGMFEVDKAKYDMIDDIRDIKHRETVRQRQLRESLKAGLRLLATGHPKSIVRGNQKIQWAQKQALAWGYEPDIKRLRNIRTQLKELYGTGPDFYDVNVHTGVRAFNQFLRWDLKNGRRICTPEMVRLFHLIQGPRFKSLRGSGLLQNHMTLLKRWEEKYNGER
jgi:hypothetical protein